MKSTTLALNFSKFSQSFRRDSGGVRGVILEVRNEGVLDLGHFEEVLVDLGEVIDDLLDVVD